MNIKELADIGARAAFNLNAKHLENFAEELTVGPLSAAYARQQPAREAFAQAVIDAYRKSVDEPAPVKEKWAEEKAAFASGKIIQARHANSSGAWSSWLKTSMPDWREDGFVEYRIAPDQISNESAFDQERRFHAETKAKLKEYENQLQYIGDICDNQDGGGTVAKCIERKVLRLYREHNETKAKLASAEVRFDRLTKRISDYASKLCMENDGIAAGRMLRELDLDDKERQEFEHYAFNERGLALKTVNGEYEDGTTVEAWESWKAARNTK